MALFAGERRQVAQAVAALCYENPYAAGRAELERRSLGLADREAEPEDAGDGAARAAALGELTGQLVAEAHGQLAESGTRDPEDVRLYEGLVRNHLFGRLSELLEALAQAAAQGGLTRRRVSSYRLFEQEAERLLHLPGEALPLADDLPHLFASLFQLRRVRHLIETQIVGHARVVADLRASMWASLFTHDMRRYGRSLFGHMEALPTLVVGPAGTIRSRVARVLALGRYVPFDAAELRFVYEPVATYQALDVGAVAPADLGQTLFGDGGDGGDGGVSGLRSGLLARAGEHGALFVDAVDQLLPERQARLLGALEGALGCSGVEQAVQDGSYTGKLIAGTQRDLLTEMREGRFCDALYYALSADVIDVPSLALQLRQRPDDLRLHVSQMLAGLVPDVEHSRVIGEVEALVERELGPRYPWPGNLFELQRCVRSVLVRGTYRPPRPAPQVHSGVVGTLSRRFADGDFNADGLLDAYCTLMYRQTGSYQEAARRLGLDRRTVKSRVDATLLAELS